MLFSKGFKKTFPPLFSFPLRLPPFLTNGCCPSATMVEALPRFQTGPDDAAMDDDTSTLSKNKHYFFDFLSHFSGDGFSDPPPLLMSPPSALTRNSPFLQQASRQLGGGERGRCPNGGAFFRERAPSALVVVVVGSKGGGYVSLPSTSSLQSHSTVHLLCSRAGKEAPFLL